MTDDRMGGFASGPPYPTTRMPDEVMKAIRAQAEHMHNTVTELERWEAMLLPPGVESGICMDLNRLLNEIMQIANEALKRHGDDGLPALGSAAADGA